MYRFPGRPALGAALCPALAAIGMMLATVSPARAHFHAMQIHRVIAGVDGYTEPQAIQLRLRTPNQNYTQDARVLAWDAAGANPVLLLDIPDSVDNAAGGATVLLATASFSSFTTPPAEPDFVLAERIPDSYLPAGSLTFESDTGIVYWRLSWGDTLYTGDTTGNLWNDVDGDFGPPWPGALPSSTLQGLRFNGNALAKSTTNAADYILTAGASTFMNNAGSAFTVFAPVTSLTLLPDTDTETLSRVVTTPNPVRGVATFRFHLGTPRSARLIVTDVAGRRVADLTESFPAGWSSIAWNAARSGDDGSALPAGVYFYRMVAGGAARAGRFVLLR